jgi:hypothetical protein
VGCKVSTVIPSSGRSTWGVIVDIHEQAADPTGIQNLEQSIAISELMDVCELDRVDLNQGDLVYFVATVALDLGLFFRRCRW